MIDRVLHNIHKFSYEDGNAVQIAHVMVKFRGGAVWVDDLWTHPDHRKQGLARKLLTHVVICYAHLVLYLNVVPYTDGPLDDTALRAWYGRFGFLGTEVPGILRRPAGALALVAVHADANLVLPLVGFLS